MRKFIILIMALCTCGVFSGEGWAARVSIAGRHSQSEIRATCGAVGGDFFSLPTGQYGCSNICAQASASCVVTCGGDGKCFGDCPRCGRLASPSRSPLPRLAGADAVTRVLKTQSGAQSDIELPLGCFACILSRREVVPATLLASPPKRTSRDDDLWRHLDCAHAPLAGIAQAPELTCDH